MCVSNSLGFLFPVFLEKFKRLLKGKATQNASDKPRERERERDTQRDHHGVRIHDQRVLREAREDRPGDVREGVQSERTSDGETGGVEEDAIGGELFKSCCACFASLFLSPGKRPPPLFFLVLPAARESVLDRRREREREASAVTRTALARARARALFRRVVGSFTHIERAR